MLTLLKKLFPSSGRSRAFARTAGAPGILRDEGGNFGMMTAILLPVLLGSVGIGLDVSNAMMKKSEIQGMVDAAALMAVTALANREVPSDKEAKYMAAKFLASQISILETSETSSTTPLSDKERLAKEAAQRARELEEAAKIELTTKGTEREGKTFTMTLSLNYDMPLNSLTGMLGFKTMKIRASGTAMAATEAKNAISMFLVMDQSGSMRWPTDTIKPLHVQKICWEARKLFCEEYYTKIEALKAAVARLVQTVSAADPEKKFARLGAVSYDDNMQKPAPLDWGTAHITTYTNKLEPLFGTNSEQAFKNAVESLNADGENKAHKDKNRQLPTKYILFMTDGENNDQHADTKTLEWCKKARETDIKVFSIAFMAPKGGQRLLLSCVNNERSQYFKAETAEELINAFKTIGEAAALAETRLLH